MSITSKLRAAIETSGKSATTIAKESGIPQPAIWRFLAGKDIRLITADRLAEYLGLDLRPAARKRK